MTIPESFAQTIALFPDSGRFHRSAEELFALASWVQVMIDQGMEPHAYHAAVDLLPNDELRGLVTGVERLIETRVDAMPAHRAFIDRDCKVTPA